MNDIKPLGSSPTPEETASRIERILEFVERSQRKRWVEIVCAVVLSLASVASAWCVYQSSRWNGVQTFRLDESLMAGQDASRAYLTAMQYESFDATMYMNFITAKLGGNKQLEQYLYDHFRPEMKPAIEAWLKTEPFTNPHAPSGPFKMKEYSLPEFEESKRKNDRAMQLRIVAERASSTSDTYVLLTVLFTAVLFFGGVSGTFEVARVRQILTVIAVVLFLATLIVLGTMPICHE